MKILICCERLLFRYGMDRVFLVLSQAFRQAGHHVTVLTYRCDPEVVKQAADRALNVPGPQDRDLESFTSEWLLENWKEHFPPALRPDIIVAGGWPFFSSIPFLRTQCDATLFSDHGAVPTEGQPEELQATLRELAILRRRYLGNCKAIVAVSQFLRETQSLPDTDGTIECAVIHNGVDHTTLPLWREHLAASANPPFRQAAAERVRQLKAEGKRVVLSLGRWEPGTYKGSEDIFEYVRLARTECPAIVALVLARPEAVAVPDDCADHVVAIGHPDDEVYEEIMRLAEAGVCFSRWEGFNLPIGEMQRLGRPAFALRLAAHPEVACHPDVLAASVAELAGKTTSWLSDPHSTLPGFAAACAEFSAEFTWARASEKYLALFSRLLADRMPEGYWQPSPYWWRSLLVIDVTNSTRDPANSGVIRVTRRLSRTLQGYCDPIFVIWERESRRWVLPTHEEFKVLGSFNGPRLPKSTYCSLPGHRITLDTFLQSDPRRGGWILLPETIQEQDAAHFRATIRALGLQSVGIFYDAIPLLMPELCNAQILANHAQYMRGLASLDVIVPISEFSAQCLRDHWSKEAVAGGEVAADLLPGEFGGAARETAPAPSPGQGPVEILCVSTLEPRKNHAKLLAALLELGCSNPELSWRLTLVGNSYAGKPEIAAHVEDLCRRDHRFRWLGIVDDAQLAALYRSAHFTVYPSFIEGYGMPIMESIWFGRPCVCHENGVMAELAKNGGCLTTNVHDVQALRASLLKLMTDTSLHARLAGEAVKRPLESWQDYGRKFISILENASTRPRETRYEHMLFPNCLHGGWQMTDSERAGLFTVLARTKPQCAIEIGTYKGGSLSLISQLCDSVFSIDIDPTIPERFAHFANVSFFTGPSTTILPALLRELDAAELYPGFILVDGDHSEAGVRDDLDCILAYRPKRPLFVVMHDSYNPVCRRGIMAASWHDCPYVQWVDTDFVPGRIIENGSIFNGEVWGGLALALLAPQPRLGPLRIGSTAGGMQSLLVRSSESKRAP